MADDIELLLKEVIHQNYCTILSNLGSGFWKSLLNQDDTSRFYDRIECLVEVSYIFKSLFVLKIQF